MRSWRLTAVAGLVLCITSTHVSADDTGPVEMEEVVVTGTRNEQQVKKIPANVTVIDQEDYQKLDRTHRGRAAAR